MTLLHCQCGSTKWTVTAEFSVGFTVPSLQYRGHTVMSVEHPEHEPKCADCGAATPTDEQLWARKTANPKRHPGLPLEVQP